MGQKKHSPRPRRDTSWDPVACWYDGWVGKGGSKFHRQFAIPAVMDLLDPQPGEHILDVGAGQGVLAPFIAKAGADYTGVEISPELLKHARQRHGGQGRFIEGDATNLPVLSGLQPGSFDALVYLLSIQDMEPLYNALESAGWALKDGGRIVILMTHPCFRIPRQSGWSWDQNRKLQSRRIDRYLTPLPVPLDPTPGQEGHVTTSFHRPLEAYINGLSDNGMLVDQFREIPTNQEGRGDRAKAVTRANQEIPLFLGLRAIKVY
jgi:SAM-dependent methyltransferase